VDIDDSISITQKAVHRLLKLREPVANVRIGAVGSIQAFVSVGMLDAPPGRRVVLIRAVDDMGNIAGDLEHRSQIQTGSYQDTRMKPCRGVTKGLEMHC